MTFPSSCGFKTILLTFYFRLFDAIQWVIENWMKFLTIYLRTPSPQNDLKNHLGVYLLKNTFNGKTLLSEIFVQFN